MVFYLPPLSCLWSRQGGRLDQHAVFWAFVWLSCPAVIPWWSCPTHAVVPYALIRPARVINRVILFGRTNQGMYSSLIPRHYCAAGSLDSRRRAVCVCVCRLQMQGGAGLSGWWVGTTRGSAERGLASSNLPGEGDGGWALRAGEEPPLPLLAFLMLPRKRERSETYVLLRGLGRSSSALR